VLVVWDVRIDGRDRRADREKAREEFRRVEANRDDITTLWTGVRLVSDLRWAVQDDAGRGGEEETV
jgi:hypothetical protein